MSSCHRSSQDKGFWACAHEENPGRFGWELSPARVRVVEKGTVVVTDSWSGYKNLSKNG